MDVHEVVETAFADAAFFDAGDAGDSGSDGSQLIFEFGRRGDIEYFLGGDPEQPSTAGGDEEAGDEGGVVVGRFVAGTADEADGDADEGGERCEGVGPMMP